MSVTFISFKIPVANFYTMLRMSSLCTGKKKKLTQCKHLEQKSTSWFIFHTVTVKKHCLFLFLQLFPQYRNCIAYSSLHTFTITTVQLKQNLSSAFFLNLIFLHVHSEPCGDLWMDANTESWMSIIRWLYYILTLGQNCPIVVTDNWTANLTKSHLPISPRQQTIFRYQHHPICGVITKHLHNTDIVALS